MPFLGIFLGKVDFSNLFINLSGKPVSSLKEATDKGLAVIGYGAFLNTVIEFLIIALVLFLIIKQNQSAGETCSGHRRKNLRLKRNCSPRFGTF
jgi:large-conductance mechanosensitive channel